ncbi:forespore capture DNA-binding protein RefZ [Bacillus sonorensis]|uniref:TetR family transcriptional regulator n=2 Tax=Bacillus sonorensis TaxID=119858 RepID=M5P7C1_9BACI|nr:MULTISPECIES: forespore capture DNA-binding protein RefZ [Bacillus]TWK77211.1 putative HTH-type transcriptional regulator YttP [Bacillus paralicheniformis]ASB87907.1 putative HTH-type transcriptional regulator YttP [Bacillus sonorensis]EME75328.1 TetR family transcriptional regulator [Bacillus sonorensis L12]MBG9915804.1 transcriptional regulator [Bacillus sonorensis]MCF7617241.1 forespore capture DNA-binding protein RefZ [Bacillus sonorensis]
MGSNSFLTTKDRIIESAVELFNQKGFSGTSVREIAKTANVNVAHISYYFNGKGGLMEHLVSRFYEGYLRILEKGYERLRDTTAKDCLLQLIFDILSYQHEHRQLTRFVYREVTIDSTLIREVMSTYLTKEKYILHLIIEKGKEDGEFSHFPLSHFMIQLKSLLTMPYLQPQYISEVLYLQPHEPYFYRAYYQEVKTWITSLFDRKAKQIAAV